MNAGRRLVMFAVCVVALHLAGCSFETHKPAQRNMLPTIEKPDRPKLEPFTSEELKTYSGLPEEVRKKLEANNSRLQEYARKLEVGADEYNGYAKYNNQLSNEALGIKPKDAGTGNGGGR